MTWFEDGALHFASGVEDTFVPQEAIGQRALDEYELTQHYRFWREDLGLVKEAGAEFLRWGVPWYRINPAPGVWRWEWLDEVMDRFRELELHPIVDLMHYGTPRWLENEFLNAKYPEAVAEYSARVAERYADHVHNYTPVNEPVINALFAGSYSHWPPYLSGDDGFVKLSLNIARGFVLAQQRMAEVLGGRGVFVHVDAGFRYAGAVDGEHQELVGHLRERAFLIEDLVTGRVDDSHALSGFLREYGARDEDFAWFADNAVHADVMGVNYYPLHSTELFEDGVVHTGGLIDPRPTQDDWTDGLAELIDSYADRYGKPIMVTETCLTGSEEDRIRWLRDSTALVRRMRSEGRNIVGYTWWPVIDMYEWTYRYHTDELENYRLRMGLWDLVPDDVGILRRVRNSVADAYHAEATDDEANGRR